MGPVLLFVGDFNRTKASVGTLLSVKCLTNYADWIVPIPLCGFVCRHRVLMASDPHGP